MAELLDLSMRLLIVKVTITLTVKLAGVLDLNTRLSRHD